MVEASGQATDGERTIIFRVRAWRSLETHRDVELLERQTLHDLHGAIQSAFELDDEHPYAFYLNNHAFDDRFDYLGPGIAASERQAETTRLETLRLKDNKRFLYVFDFGDELRHELQVVRRAERSPNASYPRQLGGEGDLPPRYPDLDLMDDPGLAEDAVESEAADRCAHADVKVPPEVRQALEAMIPDIQRAAADYHRRTDAWRHGGEDALAEDELDAPLHADQLRRDHGAALQLLDAARDSLIAIHIVVEHAIDDRVVSWLQHLPDELSDAGLNAEAVELSERVLSAGGLPALRFPLFLARLGQGERALAAVEHKLAELPDDSEVLSVAGEVHQTLGEDEAAITYYQQALEWAGSQHWLRGDIVVALLRLYERTGQASAGVRLLQREQEREEELEQTMRRKWGLPSGPVVRAQPKVGRNEPCPCGSGKKYKKCCGKPA